MLTVFLDHRLSLTHIYCSTVQMKLVKYQRGIRTSKNWLFIKSEAVNFFFTFYISSMGLIQNGNNGAKSLISYTESHDMLGHLEEFHHSLMRPYVNAQVHWKG